MELAIDRVFNLSLDDMSPHRDAGLDFESIKWCDRLIGRIPDIKINLFVPTRYSRLDTSPTGITDNREWAGRLADLPNNYRVCLHGLYHRRARKDFNWHVGPDSNNNEWELITYNQASILLDEIESDFKKCSIGYDKVFRAPGWHIGLQSVKLLTDRGYKIAGNERYYDMFKNKVNGMRWNSYTWDLIGEPNSGDVYAFGHTSSWTDNYFNEEKYNSVIKLLESDNFRYEFI